VEGVRETVAELTLAQAVLGELDKGTEPALIAESIVQCYRQDWLWNRLLELLEEEVGAILQREFKRRGRGRGDRLLDLVQ
jgi:hypothetical protein